MPSVVLGSIDVVCTMIGRFSNSINIVHRYEY